MRPTRFRTARLLASASLLAVIAAAAAGCQTISPSAETTGTLPPAAAAASPSDAAWRRDLDGYGAQYHADPTKVDVALH